LTEVLHEDDLPEIALRGYEDAATADRKRQAEAVGLFISDVLLTGCVPARWVKTVRPDSALTAAERLPSQRKRGYAPAFSSTSP
jgi:hypothetical protein